MVLKSHNHGLDVYGPQLIAVHLKFYGSPMLPISKYGLDTPHQSIDHTSGYSLLDRE